MKLSVGAPWIWRLLPSCFLSGGVLTLAGFPVSLKHGNDS